MGDHCNLGVVKPLPGQLVWVELQPNSPESNVIWLPPTTHPVHAVSDPVEPPVLDQLSQGTGSHTCIGSLAPSYESPLIVGDGGQTLKRVRHTAKYAGSWILCSNYGPLAPL